MPDDINDGGTQGEQPAGEPDKTYTQAEVDTLLGTTKEEAQKEAVTNSWSRFQSEADKKIAEANKRGDTAVTELQELKRQQMETLSPEERQRVQTDEIYKRMNSEEPTKVGADAPSGPQPQVEPSPPADSGQDEAKAAVAKILQEEGIDPEKVDWGEGADPQEAMRRFIRSVKGQQSPPDEEPPPEQSPTPDTSRGAGPSADITKEDPTELITRAYSSGNWRVRGS